MDVKDHATWKMLEKAKQDFKTATNNISRFHPFYNIIKRAHDSIVKLQYELENKLLNKATDEK